MPKDNASIVYALATGVVSSILAAVLLERRSPDWTTWLVLLFAASLSTLLLWLLWRNLRALRDVGLRNWELRVDEGGTATRDWIRRSQRSIAFMGLACSKWLSEGQEFRRMLVRHASNGGTAKFLLLDPDSVACSEMEAIKQRVPGSLAELIRKNAAELLKLRGEHFRIEVRYYSDTPRFRIIVTDDSILALALYSYSSDVGTDSPQLIFDSAPRPWSFYYAFNAFFSSQWDRAKVVTPENVRGSVA